LRNHSRKLRKEDGAINVMSFLSEIIRPVFHESHSNMTIASLSTSSFLDSDFVLPKESLHILNDSIKGYIQFSPTWKNNEVTLDFAPLGIVENYYPEEIEEELILPHYASNKPTVVQRNITSYSSNLTKGDVVRAVDDFPVLPATATPAPHSSLDVLPKATSRKPAIENELASHENTPLKKSLRNSTFEKGVDDKPYYRDKGEATKLASHENTPLKKSLRNSTFEKDGPSDKRDREPSMDAQKHSVQKPTTRGFESKSPTSLRTDSRTSLTSPSKGVDDKPYYRDKGEATKLARAIHDRSKRSTAIESLRDKNAPPPSNTQALSPSQSKQHKSGEPLNDNNNSNNSTNSYQGNKKIENDKPFKIQAKPKDSTWNSLSFHADNVLHNLGRRGATSEDRHSTSKIISRGTMANTRHEFSSPHQSASNYRKRRLISNKQDKSDAFDNTPPLFTNTNVNHLQRKRDLVHNHKAHDDQYPKLISSDTLTRRSEKVPSTVDSMNLAHPDDQVTSEDSLTRSLNLGDTSNLPAPKKLSIRDVFNTKSTFDNSNIISETDKFDSHSITINKLDVTVVGNGKDSETTENFLSDTVESSDEISHYLSEQDNIGSLNKSYLWRYKVKF
jgi:hypothetical protein